MKSQQYNDKEWDDLLEELESEPEIIPMPMSRDAFKNKFLSARGHEPAANQDSDGT
jgi:hypothetical protein